MSDHRDDPRPVPDYIRQLAWFLDDAIPVPLPLGKRRRVGADGILSLIPGVGDAAGFALSAAVVLAGARAGVSTPTLVRMVFYAALESLAGMIPLVGPVIAFAWKSNDRNLRLIEADLADRTATRRSSLRVLGIGLIITLVFLGLLAISLALVVWGLWRLLRRWF